MVLRGGCPPSESSYRRASIGTVRSSTLSPILAQNSASNALAGLVFAIDTSIGPDPISVSPLNQCAAERRIALHFPSTSQGCLIIINPTTRVITQSVCYSRASIVAVQHFATAPIVGIDARGPGLHTILIAEVRSQYGLTRQYTMRAIRPRDSSVRSLTSP